MPVESWLSLLLCTNSATCQLSEPCALAGCWMLARTPTVSPPVPAELDTWARTWVSPEEHRHPQQTVAALKVQEPTEQGQQAQGPQHRLPDQLHVGRPRVVDLEPGRQGPLGEGERVVAQEGVVVAEEGVVDGAVGGRQQVLVLLDHLWTSRPVSTFLSPHGRP